MARDAMGGKICRKWVLTLPSGQSLRLESAAVMPPPHSGKGGEHELSRNVIGLRSPPMTMRAPEANNHDQWIHLYGRSHHREGGAR